MINFHFNIRIPGSDRFRNIKCCSGIVPFSQNKFWELQIYKGSDIVDFFVRITAKQSHAGIEMGIGFLGMNIEFRIYDNRHWNKDKNNWEIYG